MGMIVRRLLAFFVLLPLTSLAIAADTQPATRPAPADKAQFLGGTVRIKSGQRGYLPSIKVVRAVDATSIAGTYRYTLESVDGLTLKTKQTTYTVYILLKGWKSEGVKEGDEFPVNTFVKTTGGTRLGDQSLVITEPDVGK